MLEYFKWHLCSIKWLLGGRIRYLALPLAYGVSTVASVISTIVVSENFHPWFSRNMMVDNLLLMALSALVIFPMLFAPAVFLHFIIMWAVTEGEYYAALPCIIPFPTLSQSLLTLKWHQIKEHYHLRICLVSSCLVLSRVQITFCTSYMPYVCTWYFQIKEISKHYIYIRYVLRFTIYSIPIPHQLFGAFRSRILITNM
jgi:hypothetical protein